MSTQITEWGTRALVSPRILGRILFNSVCLLDSFPVDRQVYSGSDIALQMCSGDGSFQWELPIFGDKPTENP